MGRPTKKPAAPYRRLLTPTLAVVLVAGLLLLVLDAQGAPKSQPITITAAQPNETKPQPKPTPKKPTQTTTKPKKTSPVPKATPKPATKPVTPSPVSTVHHLSPKPKTTTSNSGSSAGSGSTSGTGSGSGSGNPSGSGGSSTQSPVNYTSTNWAGYLETTGVYTGVAASWTVPQPTGNGSSTTADGTWIGIGGVSTSDLIQIGTDNTVSASGRVSSEAFYEMLPAASVGVPGVSVTPGDSISASISEVSAGQWRISITDNTNHETFSTTVAYTSSHSSAEWIEEDPSFSSGQLVPFDNFGTVTFSGATATIGGASQSIATSAPSSITMVDANKRPIATPSSVSGTGFTVTHN